MKYLVAPIAAVVLMVALGGCSVDDAIARAERSAEVAAAARADVQAGIERAKELSAQLKVLAAALDSEKAKAVLAQADSLVAAAEAALPHVDAALKTANDAVAAAKQAKANGDSWFNVLLGVVGTFVPAVGVAGKAIMNLRSAVALRDKAIVATADHADRMEVAVNDAEVNSMKLASVAQQEALGVKALIEKLRGP